MKRSEFDWLVRDALGSLHDWAALETHPLAESLPDLVGNEGSRSEQLRILLSEMIERLRPDASEPDYGARPWRPYLILTGRYVEGRELRNLEQQLALSTRQLGREHTRALQALSSLLQAQMSQTIDDAEPADESKSPEPVAEDAFEINLEEVSWTDLLMSVSKLGLRQAEDAGIVFDVDIERELPRVRVDRVIGRQVLLSLLSHVIRACGSNRIAISVTPGVEQDIMSVRWCGAEDQHGGTEASSSMGLAEHWIGRLGGTLRVGSGRLDLSLPRAEAPAILVVDDQEPAIHLFERYLSRTGLRVVGLRQPEQVLAQARELQPQLITLDVMMPNVDGWEVLQSLKSDPDTSHIPVVICTIWDVGEVAASFGAAGFLEKPVTQRDLVAMLQDLGVMDRSA